MTNKNSKVTIEQPCIGTITLQLEIGCTLDTIFNNLIVPALLAAQFSQQTIDSYLGVDNDG